MRYFARENRLGDGERVLFHYRIMFQVAHGGAEIN